ncbi:MAG TPA: DNA repair protein RecN [Bacteroidia bacterium]|nr:DNA repair protein RecN [Bacteroidia bacterium]
MLTRITVKNYALIDELDVRFGKGLTIITGETGAGKSILLGALSLVLGSRADLNVLLDKKRKCVVEAFFDLSQMDLDAFFRRNDLDQEPITCLRREINPEGKSRAFINDTPVNLALLREIGVTLIDVHSQHENLALQDSDFQMGVVDYCSGTRQATELFKNDYQNYQQHIKKLTALKSEETHALAQADYLRFQIDELANAGLKAGELELLEAESSILQNSDEIKKSLNVSIDLLDGDGDSVIGALNTVINSVKSVEKIYEKISPVAERLNAVKIELKDITSEIESHDRTVIPDPERALIVNERIDLLNRLLSKHRLQTTDSLLQLQNEMETQLEGFTSVSSEIKKLETEIQSMVASLKEQALVIRKNRTKSIPGIEKKLSVMLTELGMKNATVRIALNPLPDETFKNDGSDSVSFLFSANKGVDFRELSKVASGGELSRLMLCIKSLIAQASGLPTLIFDEIDTGISGAVAGRVGTIVKSMSRERQIIAITHLPQMAGKGDAHMHVYKEIRQGSTVTAIRNLEAGERVVEIAKMLSGEKPSDAALANARELLDV